MRGASGECRLAGGAESPKPLTRGRVERVVDVIGHPRSEAPVVGAVLKGSRAEMRPGRAGDRSGVRAGGVGLGHETWDSP